MDGLIIENLIINDLTVFGLIYLVSFYIILKTEKGNYKSILGKVWPNLIIKNNNFIDLIEVLRPTKYFEKNGIVKVILLSGVLAIVSTYLYEYLYSSYLLYWVLFLIGLLLVKLIPLIFKRFTK